MDLNLQVTTQTKILIGVLGIVLIVAVAINWGPDLYGLINNPDMAAKRQSLEDSQDLVAASEILKPIEMDLLKKSGLTKDGEEKHIFEDNFPETVIREKINAIVKQAGIPRNYQMNMEAVPGKRTEKTSPHARRNLVVYLYQRSLEIERDTINAEIQDEIQAQKEAEEQDIEELDNSEADLETMDMLMDAWLNESDEDAESNAKDQNGADEYENDENSDEEDADTNSDEEDADTNSDEKDADTNSDEEDADTNSDEKDADTNSDEEELDEKDTEEKTDEQTVDDKSEASDTDSENVEKEDKEQETDTTETPEEEIESQTNSTESKDSGSQWEFEPFPDSIPNYMQVELIELLLSMIDQHLVGVESTLFDNQFFKTEKAGTPGFLGFGGQKPYTEIRFRPNSQILTKINQFVDSQDENIEESMITEQLLEYLERIQSQITELSEKLLKAPTSYSPESYTVKLKFKSEMDKMVNFNRLIETSSKWLRIRDLKLSVDRKDNKINVDVLMIARVYQ